jgi:hypothetical protein
MQADCGGLCAGSASLPPAQKLQQHLFISLLAAVLLRLCRGALPGPGTTRCGGLGVGHGIATSASRDGIKNIPGHAAASHTERLNLLTRRYALALPV